MRNKLFLILLLILAFGRFWQLRAQSSYIDLTLVSSEDYNAPLATFSHDVFEQAFRISSADEAVSEPELDKALALFVDLLQPEKSYIIQHEPTYYFVFQYDEDHGSYLIMNNSIGERNEAIFAETVESARNEMLKMLQVFYSNTPVFNVTEYKY